MSSDDKNKTIQQVRALISSWIQPCNAVVLFGGTTFAVLDFLSPKIALLPIASMIAIVGFMLVAMGRRLLGPLGLRHAWLLEVLAPEKSFIKAPATIFTGLLSVLMLSGTAWSNSHRAGGGGFASAVPGVRDMQQALGVMHAIHQEQQKQTSVLEEIRDGASSNPRRVLASQGIMWSEDAFRESIKKGDREVVSLFLKGGMSWPLYAAEMALDASKIERLEGVLDALTQHPERVERKARDCNRFLSTLAKTPVLLESNSLKNFMKAYCSSKTEMDEIHLIIQREEVEYKENIAEYQRKKKNLVTKERCESDLLKNDASALKMESLKAPMLPSSGTMTFSDRESLLASIQIQMTTYGGMTGGVGITDGMQKAINKYCENISTLPPQPTNAEGEGYTKVLAWIKS